MGLRYGVQGRLKVACVYEGGGREINHERPALNLPRQLRQSGLI
jgi:hypothetical protein